MLMKIVGVQEQDYKMDNGYSFKGKKIHAIDLDTKNQGQMGNIVTTFKVSAESPLYSTPIYIDSVYKCYFTQKGALDNMELSEQAPSEQFNFMDESELKRKK